MKISKIIFILFKGSAKEKFELPEFNPHQWKDSKSLFEPPNTKVPKHPVEVKIYFNNFSNKFFS